jgi:hypothetical protein
MIFEQDSESKKLTYLSHAGGATPHPQTIQIELLHSIVKDRKLVSGNRE